MMEIADGNVADLLPDHPGHQHQVVVVDPDGVAGPVFRDDRIGKAAIDGFVEREVLDLQRKLSNEVVKHWPEDAVAEAFVIALKFVGVQRDRPYVMAAVSPLELASVRIVQRLESSLQSRAGIGQ